MAETRTYTGGCHCGAVRYRVKMALESALSCNCSMCSRAGTMLSFAPADQFELLSGDGVLRDYQFGKKKIHHLFCSRCGIKSFARSVGPDGREMVAVNVRCLDDVDLGAIQVKPFDGKSIPLE